MSVSGVGIGGGQENVPILHVCLNIGFHNFNQKFFEGNPFCDFGSLDRTCGWQIVVSGQRRIDGWMRTNGRCKHKFKINITFIYY